MRDLPLIRLGILFICVLFIPSLSIADQPGLDGLSVPEATTKILVRKGSQKKHLLEVYQICVVYPEVALVYDDTGEIGVERISVRNRPPGLSKETLCAKPFNGTSQALPWPASDGYGSALGIKGPFIFVDEPEPQGTRFHFWVYSLADKKKKPSQIEYSPHERVKIQQLGKIVSADFLQPLTLECSMYQDPTGCWQRTLAGLKIPPNVNIEQPDCDSAFKEIKKEFDAGMKSGEAFWKEHPNYLSLPSLVTISVPVHVADLSSPQPTFLSGKAICEIEP
jgi:hypothetical protein